MCSSWLLKRLLIDYSIYQSFIDITSPEIYRNELFEFYDHYKDFTRLYTDGFGVGDQVRAMVVYRTTTKTIRLPNTASIFTAELYAIVLTLAVIRRSKENNFISKRQRITLRLLYAIGRPSVVCLSVGLSVCDVGAPYSGG